MNETEQSQLTDSFDREQLTMHQKIDEWRQWWKELSEFGQPRFGEMKDRLRTIRNHLAAHFQQEEDSGFFQQVCELHPECAPQATQLLSQHQRYLNELDRLCAKLESAEPEFESWGEAKQTVETLFNELATHEREEQTLADVWKNSKQE